MKVLSCSSKEEARLFERKFNCNLLGDIPRDSQTTILIGALIATIMQQDMNNISSGLKCDC